ncbi:hypothetical protein SVIOM74S_05340 [Streptomyces violarus]
MRARSRLGVLLMVFAALVTGAVPAASARAEAEHTYRIPHTAVMDGARLHRTKIRLEHGDPRLRRAVEVLRGRADRWLHQGPWTVVDKPRAAPSGDLHDYLSQAPYWWPTKTPAPDNPWGCPYVQRDGERNPEVDSGTDRQDVEKTFDSAYDLSLAWYYTGDARYAEKAGQVLRTWFLDPGHEDEPEPEPRAVHPVQVRRSRHRHHRLLSVLHQRPRRARPPGERRPGWTAKDRRGMAHWNTAFLDWLKEQQRLRQAGGRRQPNNHGTFYDLLVAGLAYADLATGNWPAERSSTPGTSASHRRSRPTAASPRS